MGVAMSNDRSFFVGIVEGFLRGNLPILVMIGSLIAGESPWCRPRGRRILRLSYRLPM